jgi:hypothetical protein
LPHILVQPNAPPSRASGNPAGTDGIDDWFVPKQAPNPTDQPNVGSVPWSAETDASFPDDWIYPDSQRPALAAAQSTIPPPPSPQPNPSPAVSNRPPARFDPLAAYWSQIPASRVGALAWEPPIFPDSFGRFPPVAPAPRIDPPRFAPGGLLGGIPKMLAASGTLNNPPGPATYGLLGGIGRMIAEQASATDPLAAAANGILGGIPKLIPASAPASPPWDTAARGLLDITGNIPPASSATSASLAL